MRFVCPALMLTFGLFISQSAHAQNATTAPPAASSKSPAEKSEGIKHLLVRGLNFTPAQKAKVDALEKKYKANGEALQRKLQTKYAPKEKEIQQGTGTPQEKQAKADQLMKQALQETKTQIHEVLVQIFKEMDAIMTPAQKPQFEKNKTAVLESFNAQFGG